MIIGTLFVLVRTPQPGVHDEFSNLLAADTFLHGRLANPPHPFWKHFESIHIIHQPTYASKYQPGQGLLLALGTFLGGKPIAGAVLCSALASAAVCWMLGGWMPNRWAFVGGLFVALNHAIVARWTLSYWGGALPLMGGALMFGALPRLLSNPRVLDAVLLASGAIVLAATRPYEGLVAALSIAVVLVWKLFLERRFSPWTTVKRIVVPATVILVAGLTGLATYNNAVTGSPIKLPYSIHEATYGYSPLFLWQSPGKEPSYRHEQIRDYQTGWGIRDYLEQRTLLGFLRAKTVGLWILGVFYLGLPLAISLLAMPWVLKNKRLRIVWIWLALFLLAELSVPWMFPHYYAVVAPLLFLLAIEGIRYLRANLRKTSWARLMVPALLVGQFVLLVLVFQQYIRWNPSGARWERARLAAELDSTPGKDLVLVRYASDHNPNEEWVYNRADIDAASIVCAREMSPDADRRLVEYFADRKVWLLEVDKEQPELLPYQITNN